MTGVSRVLMTADTVGGVWTYALELVRALARFDVQVVLATMGGPLSVEQREDARRLSNLELRESGYKLEWMADCWSDVRRAGEWLLRIEQEVRPDCVHVNGYAHGALRWHAPVVVAGHSCVLSWFAAVRSAAPDPVYQQYAREVARGLRAADVVVAPSRAMLAALERHYGAFGGGRVIPNAVHEGEAPRARKQRFVLSAGRLWDEAKNVRALSDVASRLPWPVVLAGAERAPEGTAAAALESGAARALGPLPRQALLRWMARAAIYALPARYEPFGLSVLEAAACGCALVLGDIASLRENWSGAARFVAPDDREALARALIELIAAPERRRELSAAARARAREFAPGAMAAAYIGAYCDAVTRRRRGREEKSACV